MKNVILTIAAFLLLASAVFGQTDTTEWPTPKFRFEVEFTMNGKTTMIDVEQIIGLGTELDKIEYDRGDPKERVEKPGPKKTNDITLKGAKLRNYEAYLDILAIKYEKAKGASGTVLVKLLDQDGNSTMVWTMNKAFLKSVTGADEGKISIDNIVFGGDGVKPREP